MGDPVQDNLPRGRLSPLNRVPLRAAVQENVQFRHLGDPTTVEFAIQLNRELHNRSAARTPRRDARSAGNPSSCLATDPSCNTANALDRRGVFG